MRELAAGETIREVVRPMQATYSQARLSIGQLGVESPVGMLAAPSIINNLPYFRGVASYLLMWPYQWISSHTADSTFKKSLNGVAANCMHDPAAPPDGLCKPIGLHLVTNFLLRQVDQSITQTFF